jgi:hypothetical protein
MFLKTILLLAILFCHIVDDYYLQGWLASAKQKSWWEKNAPDNLYKNDYIMALCEHAFSWTFMIMLIPTIYTYFNQCDLAFKLYIFVFCFNWAIHCIVDDCKANKKNINFVQDQLIHILQIVITWIMFIAIR